MKFALFRNVYAPKLPTIQINRERQLSRQEN